MMTRADQVAMRHLQKVAEAEAHWLCVDSTGERPEIPAEYLDPVRVAIGYAEALCDGREPAGLRTRQAAAPFLHELRDATPLDSRWRFCPGRVAYAAAMVSMFQQVKGGTGRGERLQLMPWQLLFITAVFGLAERRTGRRKYRRAACWLPKSNGKSTLLAALAVIVTFGEGEGGAEG